jgi:hypothetical protein
MLMRARGSKLRPRARSAIAIIHFIATVPLLDSLTLTTWVIVLVLNGCLASLAAVRRGAGGSRVSPEASGGAGAGGEGITVSSPISWEGFVDGINAGNSVLVVTDLGKVRGARARRQWRRDVSLTRGRRAQNCVHWASLHGLKRVMQVCVCVCACVCVFVCAVSACVYCAPPPLPAPARSPLRCVWCVAALAGRVHRWRIHGLHGRGGRGACARARAVALHAPPPSTSKLKLTRVTARRRKRSRTSCASSGA